MPTPRSGRTWLLPWPQVDARGAARQKLVFSKVHFRFPAGKTMRGLDFVLERSWSIGSYGWSVFTFCGLVLTAIAADVRAAEKPPAADGDIVDGWGR